MHVEFWAEDEDLLLPSTSEDVILTVKRDVLDPEGSMPWINPDDPSVLVSAYEDMDDADPIDLGELFLDDDGNIDFSELDLSDLVPGTYIIELRGTSSEEVRFLELTIEEEEAPVDPTEPSEPTDPVDRGRRRKASPPVFHIAHTAGDASWVKPSFL